MVRSSAASSGPWPTTTTGRPLILVRSRGRPWPWSSSGSSRRTNSALLCVRVWSWVDRPAWAASSWAVTTSWRDLAALGHHLVAEQHGAAEHAHAATVADHRQRVAPARGDELVDHRDAGVDEDLRTAVGEPAGDHLRTVQHGRHAGFDQCVGGRAVEIHLVEDGHVSRREAAEQRRRTAVGAGRAGDAGGVGPESCPELHHSRHRASRDGQFPAARRVGRVGPGGVR